LLSFLIREGSKSLEESMQKAKKEWARPICIILARPDSQEMALAGCKGIVGSGPYGAQLLCKRYLMEGCDLECYRFSPS